MNLPVHSKVYKIPVYSKELYRLIEVWGMVYQITKYECMEKYIMVIWNYEMEYKWIIYMKMKWKCKMKINMNMKYMCVLILFWILHLESEMKWKANGGNNY